MTVKLKNAIRILKQLATNPKQMQKDVAETLNVEPVMVNRAIKQFEDVAGITYEQVKGDNAQLVQNLMERYWDKESDSGLLKEEVTALLQHIYDTEREDDADTDDENDADDEFEVSDIRQGKNKTGKRMSEQDSGLYKDLSTDAALLKGILVNQKNVSPAQIEKFIQLFEMDEQGFIANPNALMGLLQTHFGPVVGQATYALFMQMKPKYVTDPRGLFTGMPGGMPPGGGPGQNSMYGPQTQMDREYYAMLKEEKRMEMEERRMNRMMNFAMMKATMGMMQSQQPTQPGMMGMGMGGGWKEHLDANGKVVAREFVPGAPQGGGNDALITILGTQNKTLLESSLKQAGDFKDVMKDMFGNWRQLGDPLQVIKSFKDAGLIPDKSQAAGHESLDVLNAKLDMNMKLFDRKLEMKKLEHEWSSGREDKIQQAENMENWANRIQELIQNALVPLGQQFLQGYGQMLGKQKVAAQMQRAGNIPPGMTPEQYAYNIRQQQARQQSDFQQNPYEDNTTPSQQVMAQNQLDDRQFMQMADEQLEQILKEGEMGMNRVKPVMGAAAKELRRRKMQSQEAQSNPNVISEQGNESKPAPEGVKPMEFGVSVGSG